jgi:hypothetical protein
VFAPGEGVIAPDPEDPLVSTYCSRDFPKFQLNTCVIGFHHEGRNLICGTGFFFFCCGNRKRLTLFYRLSRASSHHYVRLCQYVPINIDASLHAVAKNPGLSLPDMKAEVLKSTIPAVQLLPAAQAAKTPNLLIQIPKSKSTKPVAATVGE